MLTMELLRTTAMLSMTFDSSTNKICRQALYQLAGLERAAQQYEQAARDELQGAVVGTAEHTRSDLPHSWNVLYNKPGFSEMNRTFDGALEGQRTILMTEAVEESGRQQERNGAQLHAYEASSRSDLNDLCVKSMVFNQFSLTVDALRRILLDCDRRYRNFIKLTRSRKILLITARQTLNN